MSKYKLSCKCMFLTGLTYFTKYSQGILLQHLKGIFPLLSLEYKSDPEVPQPRENTKYIRLSLYKYNIPHLYITESFIQWQFFHYNWVGVFVVVVVRSNFELL